MKLLWVFYILKVLVNVKGQSLSSNEIPDPSDLFDYPLSDNPNDIHYYFYPPQGSTSNRQEIVYGNASTIASNFNPSLQTVFLIHGFTDNSTVHLDAVVLPVYLASPLNYNYIVVDWGLLSGNAPTNDQLESLLIYTQVVDVNIPIVATRTAQFIQFLNLNPALVHLVGHSLGAHVSGLVGANYQTNNGGNKLARITGLDPAGPLFFIPFPFPKINKTNAIFVDIIHTNMGESGDFSVDGDVDFFVNGGITQPGCNLTSNVAGTDACSHQFAPILYAASIVRNIPACRCIPVSLVTGLLASILSNGTIHYNVCIGGCMNRSVLVGEPCPSTASGFYSVITSANPSVS